MNQGKEEGLLISVVNLGERLFRLEIYSPPIVQRGLPGNFCHLRVNDTYSPLLRRAFSIHQVEKEKNSFELLFKVVGPGTQILSEKKLGEKIDLLAPLGNSFSLPAKNENAVFLAGGMGIAPLFYLVNYLLEKKVDPRKISLFFGVKKKDEYLLINEIFSTGIRLHLSTEDGSSGFKGMITDLFIQELQTRRLKTRKTKFYACGPNPMLKKVSEISRKFKLDCQVSLENHMPCGVGACMGCVIKTDKGYKRVCKDGPVFDAREVILD